MIGLQAAMPDTPMLHGFDYGISDDGYGLDDDIELINDLEGYPLATPSTIATPSDAGEVTLSTIHDDIQLMHFTVLCIFVLVFVLFLVRRNK